MEYWLVCSHYTSHMREMTLAEFKMRPDLQDSVLKLDSARVSDEDGDKCRFCEKLNSLRNGQTK